MFNKVTKIATVSALAAVTALTSLSMGSVNALAGTEQLPTYVMDGTNAERAISDYFVNHFDYKNDDTVAIPHMDILYTESDGSSLVAAGNFLVMEYGKENHSLVEKGTVLETAGCFHLTENEDGTYKVFSYNKVPVSATEQDFTKIFGLRDNLANEAYAVYQEDIHSDLWNVIRAEDIAYYSYDNNLGLSKVDIDESHEIDLANVCFSENDTTIVYAQNDADIHSAGTMLATAVGGVSKDQEVVVTGLANGWARVSMNGRTGYIADSLLNESRPEA